MEATKRYPLLLDELYERIRVRLEEAGIEVGRACDIARQVVEVLRKEYGGAWHYVPKGHHYELARRDREIYEKFNGRNLGELAEEYRITKVRVYQILQACREAERERRVA